MELLSNVKAVYILTAISVGRDSSVGIETRYGMNSPGIESQWGARYSTSVQTGPAAHPAPYAMDIGLKWPGRGVDHPPHLAPRLKKE
jgi:hypothetical protein